MARTRSRTRFPTRSSRLRRRLIAGGLLLVVVWVGFFDSQSVYRRWNLSRETARMEEENALLRAEIERLQAELDRELSDEEIERIAREQYGMRRDGETVYPIKQ